MVTPVTPSLLGRGLAYPFQRSSTGGFLFTSDEALVKQSITEILLTGVRERPFVVRNGVPFGTMIPYYLFSFAEEVRDMICYEVSRALSTWEPRIIVNYTDVSDVRPDGISDPRVVAVNVNYRFRSTNRVDNWVETFPANKRR